MHRADLRLAIGRAGGGVEKIRTLIPYLPLRKTGSGALDLSPAPWYNHAKQQYEDKPC